MRLVAALAAVATACLAVCLPAVAVRAQLNPTNATIPTTTAIVRSQTEGLTTMVNTRLNTVATTTFTTTTTLVTSQITQPVTITSGTGGATAIGGSGGATGGTGGTGGPTTGSGAAAGSGDAGVGGTGGAGGAGGTGGSGSGGGSGGGIPVPGKDRASLWLKGSQPSGQAKAVAGLSQASGSQTGLSAGDETDAADKRHGMWSMAGVTWIGSDKTGGSYKGNVYTAMLGYDFKPTPKIVTGVALGYQSLNLNTSYNNGYIKNQGLTLMPYASYSITDTLIADASLGFTGSNYNTKRISTADNATGIIGDYSAFRVLGTANLTYYYLWEYWTFSGKAGVVYTNERASPYTEGDGTRHSLTDTYLGQFVVGGKVSYKIKNLSLYLGANYLYDFATQANGDRDEIQALVGFNWQLRDNWSLNMELNNTFFRDYTRSLNLVGTLRFEF